MEGTDEHSESLQQALHTDLTPGGAVALLVSLLRDAVHVDHCGRAPRNRGWQWPAAQFAYMTGAAYLFSPSSPTAPSPPGLISGLFV